MTSAWRFSIGEGIENKEMDEQSESERVLKW